jgi:acyl-CoA thioesterase FadM
MAGWTETYRGSVAPAECDITEHFTIACYFGRLDEAAPALAEELGLADRLRADAVRRRLDARFVRELRVGAAFHIESAPIGLDDTLRLGHRVVDSVGGEAVTWVEESWDCRASPLSDAQSSAIEARLATWEGPAIERRAEPVQNTRRIPSARGRVGPADLDENGRFSLGAFVQRFTTSSLHTQAAIGMTAEYMQKGRRGFSTFELGLEIMRSPRLGEPYLVEAGIAHLGSSSLRFAHRMSDPRTGEELARLGQFGVQLDLDARRPAKLPDELRARAAALLQPSA